MSDKTYVRRNAADPAQIPKTAVNVFKRDDGRVHFYPYGGGFQMSADGERFEQDYRPAESGEVPETATARRAAVALEDALDAPVACYTRPGNRWNGWAMPYFTATGLELLREQGMLGVHDWFEDGERLRGYMPEVPDQDEGVDLRPREQRGLSADAEDEHETRILETGFDERWQILETEDGPVHVMSPGAGAWVWSEVETRAEIESAWARAEQRAADESRDAPR